MGWTEDRVSVLKTLWAEGLSASQIAKQLGGGVTRNAVIGKVHRLGLAGRATPTRPAKRPVRAHRPRTVASPQARPRTPLPPPTPAHVAAAIALEPLRSDSGAVTTVLTLSDRTCKWPIGDPSEPGFAFCGRGACAGPYCQDHARLAYQPQKAKTKRVYGESEELRRMLRLASM